ncbi:chromo (CHRromatin organization MOdifier) domain-containing protein [Ditylenchus destructor]|nr:chromo (CHRromatin organization MOdifier) domain-containing protein [Ditylenchus destructor]
MPPKEMTARKVAVQREKSKDEAFEVGRILDMKTFRNNRRKFLVRWKGYDKDEDSWEPEEGLKGARRLIEAYLKENGDKSQPNSSKAAAEHPEDSSESSYEVERILDMKILRNKKRKFLVHWKDYDSDENTWEPEDNLDTDEAIALIEAYVKEHEDKSQPDKSKAVSKPVPKKGQKRQSPQKEQEKDDKNNAEPDENKSQPSKSRATAETRTSSKKGQEKRNEHDAESNDSEDDPGPAKRKTRNNSLRKKPSISYKGWKSDEDSSESDEESDESDENEPREMKSKNGPNHKTPVAIINWRYADSAPEAVGGNQLMQHVPLAIVKHEAFPEN